MSHGAPQILGWLTATAICVAAIPAPTTTDENEVVDAHSAFAERPRVTLVLSTADALMSSVVKARNRTDQIERILSQHERNGTLAETLNGHAEITIYLAGLEIARDRAVSQIVAILRTIEASSELGDEEAITTIPALEEQLMTALRQWAKAWTRSRPIITEFEQHLGIDQVDTQETDDSVDAQPPEEVSQPSFPSSNDAQRFDDEFRLAEAKAAAGVYGRAHPTRSPQPAPDNGAS